MKITRATRERYVMSVRDARSVMGLMSVRGVKTATSITNVRDVRSARVMRSMKSLGRGRKILMTTCKTSWSNIHTSNALPMQSRQRKLIVDSQSLRGKL
jgi:hypothetical protein